ncbi:MAG TPA: nuclear transport factor 2 family protein [Pseudonocardia sp.]|nr:nuclear transport factor 2 family protein [Pseudonocardia sp.]
MSTNREIVSDAFRRWSAGEGHVTGIFAEDMTWEIVGHSHAAGRYVTTREFVEQVLEPFGARFDPQAPFRPVEVRGIFADGDTVIVLWDGEGTTITGTTYRNTYAWFMKLRDGKVVDGTAFYDSISFNELWQGVQPREA